MTVICDIKLGAAAFLGLYLEITRIDDQTGEQTTRTYDALAIGGIRDGRMISLFNAFAGIGGAK